MGMDGVEEKGELSDIGSDGGRKRRRINKRN